MPRNLFLSQFALLVLLTACSGGQSTSATLVNSEVTQPAGINDSPGARITVTLVATSPVATASPLPETSTSQAAPTSAQLTPAPASEASSAFQICSPLDIHPLEELPEIISDPYRPPPPGKEERHHGVDFSYYRRGDRLTIQGVGVQAALAGRTAAAIQDRFPYGNMIIIETQYDEIPEEWSRRLEILPGESIYTLYAHLDHSPALNLGERVDACQLIGAVGKSGNTVEPHLHLEMRLGPRGQSFPSMAYYGAKDSEEERNNYVRWRTGGEFRHFDPMRVLSTNQAS